MVFGVLPKMLQVVYQSDLNKLCQSNIKEYNGIISPGNMWIYLEQIATVLKHTFSYP